MTMVAYAFLQHRRLAAAAGGGKGIPDSPPQPTLPAMRKAVVAALARAAPTNAPLSLTSPQTPRMELPKWR
jgi:hypothetical protein